MSIELIKRKFQPQLLSISSAIILFFSTNVFSTDIPYQSKWLKQHYTERMADFHLQPLKKGDIVFIGDSLTEMGMNWGLRFNNLKARNRGIKADMTYGVLARLDEMKANPPQAIFIMIGINDIFNLYYQQELKNLSSVSENIQRITEILHAALPQTRIFVQSLLPDHRDFITVLAASVNQQLQNIRDKKFTYIDLYTSFLSESGVMNPVLTTDGTHLNEKGYEIWKNRLVPVIGELK
ncbi:GDSL-type esterase/lipase family protein [Pseudoalteromonas maricaloris]|uniref:GDSL-type esterase/lipase family protein n=1 Tax=Pseudoalteromonas maricaloris TaxID=184924 RepID=UPI003C243C35